MAGATLAERYFMRDWLRWHESGEGIRTATLRAEGDHEQCYIAIPARLFEQVNGFVEQLESGRPNLQPVGDHWAIWKRPKTEAQSA